MLPAMEDRRGRRAGAGAGPSEPMRYAAECEVLLRLGPGPERAARGGPGRARPAPDGPVPRDPGAFSVQRAAKAFGDQAGFLGAILSGASLSVQRAAESSMDRGEDCIVGLDADGGVAAVPQSGARGVHPRLARIANHGQRSRRAPYDPHRWGGAVRRVYGCVASGVVGCGPVRFGSEGRNWIRAALRDGMGAVEMRGRPVVIGCLGQDVATALPQGPGPEGGPADMVAGRRGDLALAPPSLSRLFFPPGSFMLAKSGAWSISDMHPALQRGRVVDSIYMAAGYKVRGYGRLAGGAGRKNADIALLESAFEGAAWASLHAPPSVVDMDESGNVQVQWGDVARPGAGTARVEARPGQEPRAPPVRRPLGGAAERAEERPGRQSVLPEHMRGGGRAGASPGQEPPRPPHAPPGSSRAGQSPGARPARELRPPAVQCLLGKAVARIEVAHPGRMWENGALRARGVASEARSAYDRLAPLLGR